MPSMMPASLKLRLIVASLLWIIFGMILAGLILSAAFREHLDRQMREELAVDLDELRRITRTSGEGVTTTRPLSDPRYEAPDSGRYWVILRDGRVMARSSSLALGADGMPSPDMLDDSRHKAMIVEKDIGGPDDRAKLHFVVGTDQRNLQRASHQFDSTLSWSMGAFAASMITLAVLLLLYAMQPLTQVQRALAAVRGGRASRLDGRFPSEVRPLVDDLNAMMEAMGKTTQKARAQAGNLAHSLKTPLAVLTDEAYAVEKAGLKGSAGVMFEQCRRMQRHIDYQLASTRAAAQRTVPGTSARAADVVRSVSTALSRLYSSGTVRIESRVPEDLAVACDAQDLNEIVANLIDNGLKHAHTLVRVSGRSHTEAAPESSELVVEDDGPGLPPQAWDVVFDIGERWDSRAKGTGLGLPIVRDLVLLYGGRVELGTSELGGLRITVLLPAVADG